MQTTSSGKPFQRHLLSKVLIIVVLVLALLIPLSMIRGLMDERQALREQVIQDVAGSSTGPQQIIGPVLVLPCCEKKQDGSWQRDCTKHLLPEMLTISADAHTVKRNRGIYEALLYSSSLRFKGEFTIDKAEEDTEADVVRDWGEAYVAIGV